LTFVYWRRSTSPTHCLLDKPWGRALVSTVKDLVIRAVSLAGQPLTHAMTARFDAHGGTLGRSDSNTLALPDPRRHISRLQAEVVLQGAHYVLRNAGNANPIAVNQTSLPPGASAPLAHGDELQVGAYVLRVSLEDPQSRPRTGPPVTAAQIPAHTVIMASAAEPKTHPRRASNPLGPSTSHGTGPQTVGLGDLHAPSYTSPYSGATSATNPFADLLGPAAAPVAAPSPGRAPPAAAPGPRGVAPAPPALAPAARGAAAPAPAPNPWAVSPGGGAASPPRSPLPDDFDPFATTTTIGGVRAPAPGATHDDPFAGLVDRGAPAAPAGSPLMPADPIAAMLPPSSQSIDELFGLSPVAAGPRRDIIGDFLADAPAPRADDTAAARGAEGQRKRGGANLDPLAMFEPPSAAPAQRIPSTVVPDHTPELNAAYDPPRLRPFDFAQDRPAVAPPSPSPSPARALPRAAAEAAPAPAARATPAGPAPAPLAAADTPAPRAAAAAADTQALWRAFEQGAGIDALPDEARTPELMAIVGRMLRASVDGTLRLMAARAATKGEMRAQVTVIKPDRNNPLKFTLDGQVAVEQLLRPPMRGFMASTESVEDAMDDLLGHTVGTMAGMRAALQGVLARFTPAQLEAVLSEPSMLDKLLPMNRHAKLWELYLAHHARVKVEAEDRFGSLFGAAFVKAYEEQLEALEQARRGKASDDAPPPDATLPAA
jgi:FHA domain-containing protein